MSFHEQLKRLRDAVENRQKGVNPDNAYVKRRDLKELIYHFDRIDGELRGYYAERNYWKAKAEGEHLAFVAVQEENDRLVLLLEEIKLIAYESSCMLISDTDKYFIEIANISEKALGRDKNGANGSN